MSKTSYNDPTNATDPPGGKHHETSREGYRLPPDRPVPSGTAKRKKAASAKTASKAKR